MGEHAALMAQARADTGLEDFGSDSFLEGLEILVRSIRDEARLNAAGEAYMRQRIVGHLKQRLQIEDWYRRHPEIDAVEIRSPLIGLGLPRTGSTALSCLLAEDPHARSLRRFEATEPCPPPGTVDGPDPRIERDRERNRGHRSHTPTSATMPQECQDLMALDFKAQIFLAFAQVPSYAKWLMQADLTSTYFYERRALKLLQWRMPAKPWRLKAPTHILYLTHLTQAFPDARFVMTHRDPAEVMLSVAAVYADIASRFTDHLDRPYHGALNVEQWSIGMQRALAFRDAGNDSRFYDIDFRAMHRDPVGEVRGLYAWLGETVSEEFETRMTAWWQQNAETREPSVPADPQDFGLQLDAIRPLFADYTARIPAWTRRSGITHGH
ncbi:MAG TPA: sulfotransferase [Povalibacter sp.]|uniref:sulfotransferase family protein n=1 Tax=Povalibacter sp. TaxID=1962978 RepID=UPI002BA464E3|nr:sulfotransferase [Povalibacter sp.]HMN46884.1 sulfotransferase [Povalibacter sp.]